jgi:hypothetical protein
MGLDEIRAAYKTILETVDGIGKVFDYEIYIKDWAAVKDRLYDTGLQKFRWWTIRREACAENFLPGFSAEAKHRFVIRGFQAIEGDASVSSKQFDAKVEDVRATFRAKTTLNGTVQQVEKPPQLEETIDVEIAGVLCHRATLAQEVEEEPIAFVES